MPKNEFALAFNEVLEEKQLSKEIILGAIESAMVSAYRRAVNASTAQQVEAKIDTETGKVLIFAEKEVVEDVQEEKTEVTLDEARKVNPEAQLGDMVIVESTPSDFGRVAAQTARQVIQQRIREAERSAQMEYFARQTGEIVSGIVQASNAQGATIGLDMKAEGILPANQKIPNERFKLHDRIRAVVLEVKDGSRGPQIILSRAHRNFLRRLLENEVPEIYHGIVEVRAIAREPGARAKVAVMATQAGVDPVGACVGIKGVRIQAIVKELHDEKIDIIQWDQDPIIYISKAISPARVSGVYLNDNDGNRTATVVVMEDQLSLAIGRDGQNARLAAKLTSWRIDIKSLAEAAGDTVNRLQTDPAYAAIAETETANLEKIQDMLARKAQGHPLPPEEYDRMAKFVDSVEKRATAKRPVEKKEEDAKQKEIRRTIAPVAFEQPIVDSGLPDHVSYTLQENGYGTIGDLILQMKLDPDEVLKLQGIGPRAMNEINHLVESLSLKPEAEAAPEAQAAAETAKAESFADVVAAPVDEIAQRAAEEPAVAEDLTVTEPAETAAGAEAEPAAQLETAESATAEAPEGVAEIETAAQAEGEPEEEVTFDELFTLRPEIIADVPPSEEEEDDLKSSAKKKGKKKGKKHVEIEYDPDAGQTFVTKKHKRGGDEIDW